MWHPSRSKGVTLCGAAAALALVVAACGGGEATATPKQPPTQPPAPTATRAAATPTPTAAPTATAVPTRPAPTPTPAQAGIPTPVVKGGGKRGGTLTLRAINNFPVTGDTYDQRGTYDFGNVGPLLNNLIWKDPYGANNASIVGEVAESWSLSNEGTVITFKVRPGIKYHNGGALTAKDVVYNLDRAANPRSPQMTSFKANVGAMAKVEAVDDLTVRVTLKAPSNIFLPVLTLSGFLMYPSDFPFPEKLEDWKKANFPGTGPFKLSKWDPNVKMELVRNDAYFKGQGLPYLDGIQIVNLTVQTGTAAFRAGKVDASNIDSSAFQYQRKEMAKELGFVAVASVNGVYMVHLNQRAPFLEQKARAAIDMGLDRYAFANVWLQGDGDPLAPPLVPPERGGLWGIPQATLKTMVQYQEDKTAAVARGKQLLKDAGIDPSAFTINIINSDVFPQWGEIVESGVRSLGFKTKLETVSSGPGTERASKGDFDVLTAPYGLFIDDPGEVLAREVRSDGGFNYGRWKNPKLDALFDEQDRTLDFGKRKALIDQIQQIVMEDHIYIPAVMRGYFHGYFPWVKNFPTNIPFSTDNLFRWEQVWLERG